MPCIITPRGSSQFITSKRAMDFFVTYKVAVFLGQSEVPHFLGGSTSRLLQCDWCLLHRWFLPSTQGTLHKSFTLRQTFSNIHSSLHITINSFRYEIKQETYSWKHYAPMQKISTSYFQHRFLDKTTQTDFMWSTTCLHNMPGFEVSCIILCCKLF